MTVRPHPIPHTRAWGAGLALLTAIVSGFAIFYNSYGVRSWAEAGVSTATYTTAKNLVAALLIGTVLFVRSRARSGEGLTRPQTRAQWLGLVVIGLIGGSVPFLLFFEGLSRAVSTQAAFIHKSLLIWVVILAIPLLKERIGVLHVAALALLIGGQISLAGGVSGLEFASGEMMILAATLLWSVEVIVAKRLLAGLSSLTVGSARMGFGAVVLVAYGIATGAFAGMGQLALAQWGWALIGGLLLTGYVATWFAGLARAQAIDVTAVLVFGAVITSILQSGIDGVSIASHGMGLTLVSAGAAVMLWLGMAGSSRAGALSE